MTNQLRSLCSLSFWSCLSHLSPLPPLPSGLPPASPIFSISLTIFLSQQRTGLVLHWRYTKKTTIGESDTEELNVSRLYYSRVSCLLQVIIKILHIFSSTSTFCCWLLSDIVIVIHLIFLRWIKIAFLVALYYRWKSSFCFWTTWCHD